MPSELNPFETLLLALGVSLATVGLLALSFWTLRGLRKWLVSRVILILRSK